MCMRAGRHCHFAAACRAFPRVHVTVFLCGCEEYFFSHVGVCLCVCCMEVSFIFFDLRGEMRVALGCEAH